MKDKPAPMGCLPLYRPARKAGKLRTFCSTYPAGRFVRDSGGTEALYSAIFGDILGRMWKTLRLVILAVVSAPGMYGQVPCPVSLTSANAGEDSIKLEFMNKGKLPIEQLSLSCTPPANIKSRSTICHNESGIFYPGTEYWIEIAYPGANRHSTSIAVKEVRLAGGVFWNTRSSDSCRTLRVSRKK